MEDIRQPRSTHSQMQSSQPTLEANARQLYKAYMHKYAGHDIKFWIVCATLFPPPFFLIGAWLSLLLFYWPDLLFQFQVQ